jgi:hypothetical protein
MLTRFKFMPCILWFHNACLYPAWLHRYEQSRLPQQWSVCIAFGRYWNQTSAQYRSSEFAFLAFAIKTGLWQPNVLMWGIKQDHKDRFTLISKCQFRINAVRSVSVLDVHIFPCWTSSVSVLWVQCLFDDRMFPWWTSSVSGLWV